MRDLDGIEERWGEVWELNVERLKTGRHVSEIYPRVEHHGYILCVQSDPSLETAGPTCLIKPAD